MQNLVRRDLWMRARERRREGKGRRRAVAVSTAPLACRYLPPIAVASLRYRCSSVPLHLLILSPSLCSFPLSQPPCHTSLPPANGSPVIFSLSLLSVSLQHTHTHTTGGIQTKRCKPIGGNTLFTCRKKKITHACELLCAHTHAESQWLRKEAHCRGITLATLWND